MPARATGEEVGGTNITRSHNNPGDDFLLIEEFQETLRISSTQTNPISPYTMEACIVACTNDELASVSQFPCGAM